MVAWRNRRPNAIFQFELPVYQSGQSDLSARLQAAPSPSLADETI
jgi:hypothetical protein